MKINSALCNVWIQESYFDFNVMLPSLGSNFPDQVLSSANSRNLICSVDVEVTDS